MKYGGFHLLHVDRLACSQELYETELLMREPFVRVMRAIT
jgi:hypothetical protein